MTRVIPALIASSLLVALAACGGPGEREPAIVLLLEADLSGLPADANPDAVMTGLVNVLQRRAVAFGAEADVQRQEPNRVSVTLRGVISEQSARDLMEGQALLDLRRPILDDAGRIVCQAAGGPQFSVPREEITYVPSGLRALPRCAGGDGQAGDILWEPVTPDGQGGGQEQAIVAIQPANAVVDRTEAPILLLTFAGNAGVLLQDISTQLVALPMGIFLDGELLAGPTVNEPITTANLVIPGLSLHEANILAAQFNGGPLPVPIREVEVEETP